ncbi:MAG: cobalt-precorrin-5B (C(1))-methyltransferase CbiD [Gloeocapsa sp. UFS-A4-WI-NPMV-4B04]|jgi:cobalt-precorrin-5B (C1)-methyltransferase|nr:cobalt-precorrin-5B (C(1))-methyltransferase CbiD [Gloeocapsa sp. UFS-A4-WI-NPMV-4B04]
MVSVNLMRSGYTLPVFACAAAVAALHWLRQDKSIQSVQIDLVEPPQIVEIPVEQTAGLRQGMALAITRSDPGDNLDLTRNTPIWALVEWVGEQGSRGDGEAVVIKGGEGLGRLGEAGEAAIYAYAQKLIRENLGKLLKSGEKIEVTIILPEGRRLAERTSNAAFGVVDGLSLLGITGISQPLSAPGQLDACREEVQQKASCFECLVFCVGENGLDLAAKLGINPDRLVKTANWLGPLLVEAGLQGVKTVLLFGYHGKLIKLAGGIFHTHHHLADGRLEILTAHCAQVGLPTPVLQAVFASSTAEAALKYLRDLDATEGSLAVSQVYSAIAETIDRRSQDYIFNHSERRIKIGSILFDRDRQIIVKSQTASTLLAHLC